MQVPHWLQFFERVFPSANMVLIRTRLPILIDTGFGSDVPETEHLLRTAGVLPEQLHPVVNTHYHCDHVGGDHALQQRYDLPIAAHRWDALTINYRDPEVCSAAWLNHPVESYRVTHYLGDGDEIDAGDVKLQVLHTPGHTLGHLSLYALDEQILICGDVVHRDDVALISSFRSPSSVVFVRE